ncbi:MAG: hypothetical protein ISS01_03255 [Nanoarchaeota archaeon]|nr:hypothetical protein [Nanoarchaeota archaeon]
MLELPVEEVLTYGRVLDRYYSGLCTDRSLDPMHYGLKVMQEEGLERKFLKSYQQMILRTSRAKNIMEFYEDKFGINEEGKIVDSRGLHKRIFHKDLKTARARSYGISIGFNRLWREKDSLGYVTFQSYDDLDQDWNWIRANLERGKNMSSHGLVFFVKKDTIHPWLLNTYQESRRDISKLEGLGRMRMELSSPEEIREMSTVDHELRHVIENIMGTKINSTIFKLEEIKASLVTNKGINGVRRDCNDLNNIIDTNISENENAIESLGKLDGPVYDNLRKHAHKKLMESREQKKQIEGKYERFEEHIRDIPEEHWRTLSYVVSITPDIMLLEQLERIGDHF